VGELTKSVGDQIIIFPTVVLYLFLKTQVRSVVMHLIADWISSWLMKSL